jgi:hypothetical protein
MSKHPPAGSPGTVRPPDDLERNPGIGQSKGATMSGADADQIIGENTVEGDVGNDVRPSGMVDPEQQGRTNN